MWGRICPSRVRSPFVQAGCPHRGVFFRYVERSVSGHHRSGPAPSWSGVCGHVAVLQCCTSVGPRARLPRRKRSVSSWVSTTYADHRVSSGSKHAGQDARRGWSLVYGSYMISFSRLGEWTGSRPPPGALTPRRGPPYKASLAEAAAAMMFSGSPPRESRCYGCHCGDSLRLRRHDCQASAHVTSRPAWGLPSAAPTASSPT